LFQETSVTFDLDLSWVFFLDFLDPQSVAFAFLQHFLVLAVNIVILLFFGFETVHGSGSAEINVARFNIDMLITNLLHLIFKSRDVSFERLWSTAVVRHDTHVPGCSD
jgi:branched-subunit amino acid ABC-type transport system permease component